MVFRDEEERMKLVTHIWAFCCGVIVGVIILAVS